MMINLPAHYFILNCQLIPTSLTTNRLDHIHPVWIIQSSAGINEFNHYSTVAKHHRTLAGSYVADYIPRWYTCDGHSTTIEQYHRYVECCCHKAKLLPREINQPIALCMSKNGGQHQ